MRLGCRYVQVDATDIATLADPAVCAQYDRLGIGADRMLAEGVELLNSLTESASAEVTLAIHLCKGNSEGRYIAAGAYDAIAAALVGARRSSGIASIVPTRIRSVAWAASVMQTNGSPASSGESTKPAVAKPCSSANATSSQQP